MMAGNKDNMRQAMKELLGLVGIGSEEKEREDSAAEVDLKVTQQEVAETVDKGFFHSEAPKVAEPVQPEPPKAAPPKTGFFSFGGAAPKQQPVFEEAEPVQEEQAPPAIAFIRPGATVISAGTSLFGDVRAEGDVEVLGKLKGNLEATGNVRITGKVLGDVKGAAIQLAGCAVQGNVTAIARVSLDEKAMVVGDILATDLESDGKVKGNIQVSRTATFQSKAVLAGNVTAGMISMSQGTRIQGAVRIAEDPETNSLFGDGLEI